MRSLRTLALPTLVAASLLTAAPAIATTPANGIATAGGDTLTWSGGPIAGANPTPATCVEPVSCDSFRLDLVIPPGQVAVISFRLDWGLSQNDLDLFILDQDGVEWGSSLQGGTTFEQTVVEEMPAGSYRVLASMFSGATPSFAGRLTVLSVGDPSPESSKILPRLRFDDDTIVDFKAVSGEPFIRVDLQDETFVSVPFGLSTSISLLWKSLDGGESYIPLGTPVDQDSISGPGGGDSHLDFDAENRLYFVDLGEPCITAGVSEDGGNTFPPQRTNSVMCLTGNPASALDDRQWIGAFGDGIGYATWRNLAGSSFWLYTTRDGGLSWDGGTLLGEVDQSGPFQVDKAKRILPGRGTPVILSYQVYYDDTEMRVFRIADPDDGSPLVVDDLAIVDPGESVSNVFPQLAVDTAGNLYAAWSQGAAQIYMATSSDYGETWSAPFPVSSTSGTNIMPWVVAGDPGRVAVVWYRSPVKNNLNLEESVWDVFFAQSINALNTKPRFQAARLNDTIIHRGEICLDGLFCDIEGSDRSFLEFPSVSIDSRGAAVVTFNDNTNQVDAPYVMVSKQTRGPSLYESVGVLKGPKTQTSRDDDETGDARYPASGAAIGANVPALDILSVEMSDDSDDLTVTMEIADTTAASLAAAPAQVGGNGVLFVTQWEYAESVHWVAAEVRGGQPSYLTGTLGAISTTGPKYITYRPDLSAGVTGRIVAGTPGRIELTVPRSLVGDPADGDQLAIVTGFVLSEQGPLVPITEPDPVDPSTLPQLVDAAGSFHHSVGGN